LPALRQHVHDAIIANSDISSQSLRDQWQQLVLGPLSKLDSSYCYFSYVLVVDALDECDNPDNIRIILQLLAQARLLQNVRLRVFLTSRPEVPVRHGFTQIPDVERQDFVLQSISPSIVDHDISVFLEHKLTVIGQYDEQEAGWPGTERIQHLVSIASGLFIWAATACRFICEGQSTEERLCLLLEGSNAPATPEEHLNGIYTTVLQNSLQPGSMEQERQRFCMMPRQILGTIVVLSAPLSLKSLTKLLYTSKSQVNRALKGLHAILDIPSDENRPLYLHHPSFRDFLLNNNRCKDRNFWVDEKQAHQTLADSCIQVMSTSLKHDICGLNTPGTLISDVDSNRIQDFLPLEVQYASLYWVYHLQKSGTQLYDQGQVHQFLQEKFLFWLEALSWMGKISEGIYAIATLEALALVSLL
jgi:hypothetical protein